MPPSPKSTPRQPRLLFPIALLLILCLLSGASLLSIKQIYVNPQGNLRLEKPFNWDVEYYERNGAIYLNASSGIAGRDTASITIWAGNPCHATLDDPYAEVEAAIERKRNLYYLDSLTILQKPVQVAGTGHKVIRAAIALPKSAQSTADQTQAEKVGDGSLRTIELFAIGDQDHYYVLADVYPGDSPLLNAQAETILESVQITCVSE